MPQPERVVGYKTVSLRDGKEYFNTLVAQTPDTQTWMDSDGCRVVVPRTGFGPALEFTNCEGSTGTQTVKLLRGAPYPLTLGSKWVYAYSGTNARGDQWTGQRHCEVEGAAQVAVNGAEHDAYKVVCEDISGNTKTTRTYYVSPALQTIVFRAIGCGTGWGRPRPTARNGNL
jgi:hypothetical protein